MKIIYIVLFFINSLYAGRSVDSSGNIVYIFDVENGSMVDSYFNIFNSIAMFFQSNDYLELLKVVFLLGGFLVLTMSIMNSKAGIGTGTLKDFLKYLLIGTALLTLMFSHKSQMVIKTNNIPSFCPIGISAKESIVTATPTTGVVVGNIPEVLAWTFSLINEVGKETTRLATIGFTAVDANLTTYTNKSDTVSYLEGINTVLNSNITDYTSDFNTTDKTTLVEGLNSLYRDCIIAPAAITGDSGSSLMTAITNTGNLKLTLKDYFNTSSSDINIYLNPTSPDKNTVVTNYRINNSLPADLLGSVNGEIFTCSQIWSKVEIILNALEASNKFLCQGKLKDYWNPETMAILTGDNTLTGSAAGKSIVLNAALANQMYDLRNNIAPGEISYASGKTIAELVNNNVGQGFYIAQMLPYLQMGMRAIIYSFFPLVFIVVLLPGGISVLKNYLQTLIWIELWTPVAAVLNMFLSIMSTDKFADMYNVNGFNPTQGLTLLSDSAMLAGIAGYLYASIPALTWLLLKNSGEMLTGLGEGLAAKLSANLDSDNILKDKKAIDTQNKVNKENTSQGKQLVSLAEIDSLNAKHDSWNKAGEFKANQETLGKAKDSGYGKDLDNIISSAAVGELFNGQNGQKYKNSVEVSTKSRMEKTAVEQTVTGQLTKEGNIDDKRAHDVKVGLGTVKGIESRSKVNEHQFNEKRDPKNPNYEEKLSEAKGINLSAKDFGEVKEQNERAVLHDKDPNNAMQKLKEADIKEMTNIAKTLQDESTTQSYFMQKGVFNKDANGDVERNGEAFNNKDLQKIMYTTGKFNAGVKDVQDKINQGKITNHGKEGLVKNELITLAKGIGENKSFKEAYTRKLNEIIKNGGIDSNKAEKALEHFKNGNFYKGIEQSSGVAALQGVIGSMRSKVESDMIAEKLNKSGFTTNDSSNTKTTEIVSKLLAGSIKFDELSNTKEGLKILEKAFDRKDSTFKEFQERAKLAQDKELFIQKAIIGDNAMESMKATIESFESVSTNSKVEKLENDGYTAKDIGEGKATSTEIENIKNITYGALGVKTVASMQLASELTHLSNDIDDMFDMDPEKKKTKEELRKEQRDLNRKNKLEELRNKENLNSREKNQLRRLEAIENKILNEMKETSFRDKIKKAITLKGAIEIGGQLTRAAVSTGVRIGGNILAESLVGGEVVMAAEMAAGAVVAVGAGTAAVGMAIVTTPIVAAASITDNLDTANENIRIARNFSQMANKISEKIDSNTIGTVGSFNINNDPDNKNMAELERSAGGKYFIKINNERYETTFTDSEFKNKEFKDSIKEVYFMESLKEAFEPGLTKEEISKQIAGAFAVKDSIHNGFLNKYVESSFAANTMEKITEYFH